jgi:AraC family transcriptional regulator of adaptative response/methylated-DNA-[protein]-cysteine methyltransferase
MNQNNNINTSAKGEDTETALSKAAILQRLEKTKLNKNHKNFQIEPWNATDDSLPITWEWVMTSLGELLIATTPKGICFLGFGDEQRAFTQDELQKKFPKNPIKAGNISFREEALGRIESPDKESKVHLHLKGTAFQMKVWDDILRIPSGGVTTYSALAESPSASRAVGSAVGANPVCLIIGCHRVVHADGDISGYHYGDEMKRKLLIHEIEK